MFYSILRRSLARHALLGSIPAPADVAWGYTGGMELSF